MRKNIPQTLGPLNNNVLRELMLIDRIEVRPIEQADIMQMNYSCLMSWSSYAQRFPYHTQSTDMRILNYLIHRGYISITISKKPFPI